MQTVSWLNPIKAQIFATTRWTVVRACNHANEAQAREALAELAQAYWQPVYVCIRHQGYGVEDAQDLTQDFFVRLLGGRYLKHLDQAKGHFRSYLAVALQNFLRDQWRRRWTWRRGRGITVISLDAQDAENGYKLVPASPLGPDSLYERRWAQVLIGHVFEQLRIELQADHKETLCEYFDAILAGKTNDFPYLKVAAALNLTVPALHSSLFRWRRRFQALMREEIARTVLSKTEIEDELRHLLSVFAQNP